MSSLRPQGLAKRPSDWRSLPVLALVPILLGLSLLAACQGPGEPIYVTPRPARSDVPSTDLTPVALPPPLASPRYLHTATLLESGKVLVVGGRDADTSFLATPGLYDPAANSWAPAAAMAEIHSSGATATRLPEGQVLIVGGFGTRSQAEAERYDPATNRWAGPGGAAPAQCCGADRLVGGRGGGLARDPNTARLGRLAPRAPGPPRQGWLGGSAATLGRPQGIAA